MKRDLLASASVTSASVPLVVDLDGTLIRSDLLWEALQIFLRTRFLQLWRLPLWLLRGTANFKRQLARAVCPDASHLPYDGAVLALIDAARAAGRLVVLTSSAHQRWAEAVAAHLARFDLVLATGDEGANLSAEHKSARLLACYGAGGFDYIGKARADIPVWRQARHSYAVSSKPIPLGDGRATASVSRRAPWALALLRALRPRQWLKNLLVLVPMLASHTPSADHVKASLIAFAAFCLCASSAYLLNDALDANDDRRHPVKRWRPIAAGALPLPVALLCAPLLAAGALLLCSLNGPLLSAVMLLYLVSTLAYSLMLKRLLMIDAVTLSLLYIARILGGSAATGIVPSFWLLAFSFFIFLSLALLKRYSELTLLQAGGKHRTSGRSYLTADQAIIGMMGVSSALLSVVIYMLYFNSSAVLALYPHPAWLMAIVPLLAFWLGRLWLLAGRGEVNDDPILYLSRDKVSLALIALCAALATAAAY